MEEQSFAEGHIPTEVFRFSGQSALDTWTLKDLFHSQGWTLYDHYLSHEPELCFERIRELVAAFPTWQHRRATGRPAVDHRTHLVALLLRQYLRASFRQIESYLRVLGDYFGLQHAPDATTLSLHNRSRPFVRLLRRFHRWILDRLPQREATIATDATGFSAKKKVWSQTDYGLRVQPDWTKAHVAVEVPQLLVLHHETTPGRVHDSQMFEPVWRHLPDNVRPKRSLADAAYASDEVLATAKLFGATPLHGLKHNARHHPVPRTDYEKLVNFARHWPNRYRALTGLRGLVESAFNSTKNRFGDRLLCRSKLGRVNEVQARFTFHNIRTLVMRDYVTAK